MSAWLTITVDDLRDTKASALVDAFQTAALGDGQTDPVPRKINSICDRIRAEIQASSKYKVSATAHSIPASLFDLAGRLIAWDMQGRLNIDGNLPPTEQDKIDHANDLRYLERIARGDVTIETPDDPLAAGSVQSGGSIEQVSGGRRQATREKMEGL